MKIAVVGFGYWGPNLVRNFNSVNGAEVVTVCDARPERLQVVGKLYPKIRLTGDYSEILNDPAVDAVVIATPVFTHFVLARQALEKDKHVLLEKPMTSNTREAVSLIELAEKRKKLLMVDHTFLYTGAVQKMKNLIDTNAIGKIKYFDSTRINLGLFQPDINVLWDLAPHDISILNYLINDKPFSVNATGVSHTGNDLENIAYLTVNYESGFIAHFNCSWSSPVKIRMMLIGGDKKMLVYNDLEPTEKIRIYDTGYDHRTDEEKRKVLVDYRAGDVFIPKLDMKEALLGMATDFVNSAEGGRAPVSDYRSGLEVISVLEAAQQSIKQKGKEILLTKLL